MDGPTFGNPPPGLIFNINGQFCFWRGIALAEGPHGLPVWTVDVDGHGATAATLESALIMAGRAAVSEKEPA